MNPTVKPFVSVSPDRRSRPGRPATLALLLALAPIGGWAQSSFLTATLRANTTMTYPAPREDRSPVVYLSLTDTPAAATLQLRDTDSHVSNGGTASALFKGRIGLLKAYAFASQPYCCTIGGELVTTGFSDAAVDAGFGDTVNVSGAGLADGTAVQYRVGIRIDGTLSSPTFEMGGHVGVYGVAEVRLEDKTTREVVSLRWNAANQATGLYELTLNTQVGHQLSLVGYLNVGANIDTEARTARSGEADFYHSATYSLTPSVAGLNTVGASGVDFAVSSVPEPAPSALLLAGGGLLAWHRRGVKRRGPR